MFFGRTNIQLYLMILSKVAHGQFQDRLFTLSFAFFFFCVCKIINGFGDLSKLMPRKSGGVGHNSQMSCCIHFPKDPWCGNLLGARVCTGFGKYPCLWVTVLLMLMSWCRLMTLHFARFACWFMCLKNHMSITRLKWICQFECAVQSADITDRAGQNDI